MKKRNVRPGKHESNLVSLLFYYAYHAQLDGLAWGRVLLREWIQGLSLKLLVLTVWHEMVNSAKLSWKGRDSPNKDQQKPFFQRA